MRLASHLALLIGGACLLYVIAYVRTAMLLPLSAAPDARASRPRVILLTSYYAEPMEERRRELGGALQANLDNPHIDAVCLLVESRAGELQPELPNSPKLSLVTVKAQPTYTAFLHHANNMFPGDVVIVQNTDIVWKPATTTLLHHLPSQTVFALSRHPHPSATADRRCSERQQCEDYNGSHDVFVFRSPMPAHLLGVLDFRQNLWGAENRVIYELKAAGLTVLNPCKTIITTHHHCSRKRTTPHQRINRQKGDRYGDFYKSGFVASTKLFAPRPDLVRCLQVQDDSYSIPFVDKDPRALLGKNMSRWLSNVAARPGCSFTDRPLLPGQS
eukprot:GGOE01046374.1.p1 GENE.GGOE01046374.1~~GGOE01046374.1.p1  ORF type:complete len:330 (-),score=91.98 GGOE01046374.1:378-1367(-)